MRKYSKKVKRIAKRWKENDKSYYVPNKPLFEVLKEEKSVLPKYRIFNYRFIINQKDHPLEYQQFDRISKLSNKLYNRVNSIQRTEFFSNDKILTYQDLKKLFEESYSIDNLTTGPAIYADYLNMPKSSRLGILYDVCSKWYDYTIDLLESKKHDKKIPSNRKGKNRRCSFTINPSSIKLIKNNYSNTKFKYLIVLPKEFNINGIELSIPTNITYKRSISEIRITPNRGIFIVDVKYSISFNNNPKDYICYYNRYAGIDIGLENVIALATTVGTKPLLIKGRYIIAKNAYYNKLMKKCKIGSKKWNNLNNRRINIINDYFNKSVKLVIDYLDVACIKTLYIGKSKYLSKGFLNKVPNNFMPIDYTKLIDKLVKLCKKHNIKSRVIDEHYTSTTSILDYNDITSKYSRKTNRLGRIYCSKNFGLVNSDINAAFNMIAKYSKESFLKILTKVLVRSKLKGRMVTPVVINDIRETMSLKDIYMRCIKSGIFIQMTTWQQNSMAQHAKPFKDYWTSKFEVDRATILIK